MELLAVAGLALLGRMLNAQSIHQRAKPRVVSAAEDSIGVDEARRAEADIVRERYEQAKRPYETGVFATKYLIDQPVPFRASRASNEDDQVKQGKLELFTGIQNGSATTGVRPNKREVAPLFRPEESMTLVDSSGSGGNPYLIASESRFVPGMYHSNLNPGVRVRDAPLDANFRVDYRMPHDKKASELPFPTPANPTVPFGGSAHPPPPAERMRPGRPQAALAAFDALNATPYANFAQAAAPRPDAAPAIRDGPVPGFARDYFGPATGVVSGSGPSPTAPLQSVGFDKTVSLDEGFSNPTRMPYAAPAPKISDVPTRRQQLPVAEATSYHRAAFAPASAQTRPSEVALATRRQQLPVQTVAAAVPDRTAAFPAGPSVLATAYDMHRTEEAPTTTDRMVPSVGVFDAGPAGGPLPAVARSAREPIKASERGLEVPTRAPGPLGATDAPAPAVRLAEDSREEAFVDPNANASWGISGTSRSEATAARIELRDRPLAGEDAPLAQRNYAGDPSLGRVELKRESDLCLPSRQNPPSIGLAPSIDAPLLAGPSKKAERRIPSDVAYAPLPPDAGQVTRLLD